MRVTEHTNYNTIRNSIEQSKGRMENLQMQASTLRKLNTPSDDPVGSAKVLEVRTEKVNNDQFLTNAKMTESFLNNSDQALSELGEIVLRAKEIALGQASGASSNDDTRLGVSEEVTQLYQQAIASANRKIGDRYIFGGYKTAKAPIDEDGRYHGDDGQMMVEIAKDVFLSMNVPGIEIFNTNPKSSIDGQNFYQKRIPASENEGNDGAGMLKENVNLFGELQNLKIGLLTGDTDAIRSTLERFDQIFAKINATRARIGSRVQGLQNTSQALERHNINNAQVTSMLEDADMAQVVSDLAKEETVYRSALQSSQKLIQPTLLDFLK